MKNPQPMIWKVGEIAEMTGLSVRTLHHYDEIGLLKPASRSESGHRLFNAGDLARLQQILSLRHLGLSLEEIQRTLDDPAYSFAQTLVRLRRQIARQRQHLEQVESRLSGLEHQLAKGDNLSIEKIIQFLEAMAMYEKYLTKEQLEKVAAAGQKLGPERIEQVQSQEWPRLIAEVQRELNQGTPPSEPRLVPLAQKWMALVAEFTGGDMQIAQGLRKMYETEPRASERAGFSGVEMPRLMNYIAEVLAAAKAK